MDLTSSPLAAVVLALLQLGLVRMVLSCIQDATALRMAGAGSLLLTLAAAVAWPLLTVDFGAWPMLYLATFAAGLAASWYQRTRQLQQAV